MKTAQEINKISTHDYLKARGVNPAKRYSGYYMYQSPFREENTPSFKVSETKNLWVDYGTGEGGTLIDLVLKMNPGFSVLNAMMDIDAEMITDSISFFHQQQPIETTNKVNDDLAVEGRINIYKIKELGSNKALTDYLNSRGINLETAKGYCKEIYFKIGQANFFAIGCKNENGGWAIRNKFWKGCSSQAITLFKKGHTQLAVFEGLFDLLSYLQIKGDKNLAHDFMVLNSLTNVRKALPQLADYNEVVLYLDRDTAGQKATEFLKASLKKCDDLSTWYAPHKDLNEYLISGNTGGLKRSARSR